jgi:tight adherence protein B
MGKMNEIQNARGMQKANETGKAKEIRKANKPGKTKETQKTNETGKTNKVQSMNEMRKARRHGRRYRTVCEGRQDYEVYVFNRQEWALCILQMGILSCLVNYLCYRSWWMFLAVPPAAVWFVKWKKNQKLQKRRQILYYHFQDVLHGLLAAVRAGYSMEHAVAECRKELEQIYGCDEDFVKELSYMEKQMKVGVPLEQLFLDLGGRCGVEDIRDFGEIFLISRRSGGNLGEIMEKMAFVLGEKIKVRKEIDVCIAGKQTEQLVMSMVPGGMILYMQLTSEGFLDVLYNNAAGVMVMTVCLVMYLFSFWMGKKIVRIAV